MKTTQYPPILIPFLAAFISAAISLILLSKFNLYTDSFFISDQIPKGVTNTINFSYNSFFSWQIDHFWTKFFNLNNSDLLISLNIFVFSLGLSLLMIQSTYSYKESIAAAVLTTTAILLLFGVDVTVLGVLVWLPWLMLALNFYYTHQQHRILALLVLFFISLRNCGTAQYLAIIPAILALVITPRPKGNDKVGTVLALAVILIPALYSSFITHLPIFPDYPLLKASLVADDGIPGFIRPLFGPELSLPVIDRYALKSIILPASIFLFLTTLSTKIICLKQTPQQASLTLLSGMVFFILLDSVLPEFLAQIGPIATFARIVPGLFLIPLSPLFLSLAIALLPLYIRRSSFLFLVLFILILIPTQFSLKNLFDLSLPRLKVPASEEIIVANLNNQQSMTKLISPSYKIIRERGINVLDQNWQNRSNKITSAKKLGIQVVASVNQDMVHNMLDRKANTRWTTNVGSQSGKEWLLIKFPALTKLDGIVLNIGSFTSDFPRGVKISSSQLCDLSKLGADLSIQKTFNTIIDYPSWIGPTLFSERGYPYYGPQSWMKIDFNDSVETNCLLIEQTGKNSNFDWSIAKLGFIVP